MSFKIDNKNGVFLKNYTDEDGEQITDAVISCTVADYEVMGYITDVSGDGVSPVAIESTGHGLTTGDEIVIVSTVGNKAANGPQVVTVIDANNFTLNGTTGDGDWIDTSASDEGAKPRWYAVMPGLFNQTMDYTGEATYRTYAGREINFKDGHDYYIIMTDLTYEFHAEAKQKAQDNVLTIGL